MADIFISYSKPDRFEIEKLAATLAADGWSVWWDKSLSAGDQYRDEIMKELARARAVVVVWTANSIKSDWVRAEAGQAKANGKLIPVKADGVGYGDIPLPFGEMHTEPIGNKEIVAASIRAVLARPVTEPAGFRMAAAEVRSAALTWFGIIGGAITLFANLKGVVALAGWATTLVEHWNAWTHAIWHWFFAWFKYDLSPYWAPPLTLLAFLLSLAIGQNLLMRRMRLLAPANETDWRPSIDVPGSRGRVKLVTVAIGRLLIAIAILFGVGLLLRDVMRPLLSHLFDWRMNYRTEEAIVIVLAAGLVAMAAIGLSKDKLQSGLLFAFLVLFGWIVAILPTMEISADVYRTIGRPMYDDIVRQNDLSREVLIKELETTLEGRKLSKMYIISALAASAIVLFLFHPLSQTFVAAKQLNKRFLFLSMGVAGLVALNAATKLIPFDGDLVSRDAKTKSEKKESSLTSTDERQQSKAPIEMGNMKEKLQDRLPD